MYISNIRPTESDKPEPEPLPVDGQAAAGIDNGNILHYVLNRPQ